MTTEEMMKLKIGDVVVLHGCTLRVIEVYYDSTFIVVKSLRNNYVLKFNYECGSWEIAYGHDSNSWNYFDISRIKNSKPNIETIQKKIEEKKSELESLEKTLNELKEKEDQEKLQEQISKMIVGDFYTVELNNGNIYTSIFRRTDSFERLVFSNNEYEHYFPKELIKQIIHQPNLTNEYKSFLKKIENINSSLKDS